MYWFTTRLISWNRKDVGPAVHVAEVTIFKGTSIGYNVGLEYRRSENGRAVLATAPTPSISRIDVISNQPPRFRCRRDQDKDRNGDAD